MAGLQVYNYGISFKTEVRSVRPYGVSRIILRLEEPEFAVFCLQSHIAYILYIPVTTRKYWNHKHSFAVPKKSLLVHGDFHVSWSWLASNSISNYIRQCKSALNLTL